MNCDYSDVMLIICKVNTCNSTVVFVLSNTTERKFAPRSSSCRVLCESFSWTLYECCFNILNQFTCITDTFVFSIVVYMQVLPDAHGLQSLCCLWTVQHALHALPGDSRTGRIPSSPSCWSALSWLPSATPTAAAALLPPAITLRSISSSPFLHVNTK